MIIYSPDRLLTHLIYLSLFSQAVPETVVYLPFSFSSSGCNDEPSAALAKPLGSAVPQHVVGLAWKSPGWEFVFTLGKFQTCKHQHGPSVAKAGLFGKIESGADLLDKLSKLKHVDRSNYAFGIHSTF